MFRFRHGVTVLWTFFYRRYNARRNTVLTFAVYITAAFRLLPAQTYFIFTLCSWRLITTCCSLLPAFNLFVTPYVHHSAAPVRDGRTVVCLRPLRAFLLPHLPATPLLRSVVVAGVAGITMRLVCTHTPLFISDTFPFYDSCCAGHSVQRFTTRVSIRSLPPFEYIPSCRAAIHSGYAHFCCCCSSVIAGSISSSRGGVRSAP